MFNEDEIKFINEVIDRNQFYVEMSLAEVGEDYLVIKVNYMEEVIDTFKIWLTGVINVNSKEDFYIKPALCKVYILLDLLKNIKINKIPSGVVRCKNLAGELVDGPDKLFAKLELTKEDLAIDVYASNILNEMRADRKKVNSYDKELKEKNLYHSFSALKGLLV